MSRDVILIEDKRFDINNLPKKVLKGTPDTYYKAKVGVLTNIKKN